MMSHIQIRIDEREKMEAQEVLKSMGMTVTSAVRLFLTQVVNERRIPFEITAKPKTEWKPFAERKIGS